MKLGKTLIIFLSIGLNLIWTSTSLKIVNKNFEAMNLKNIVDKPILYKNGILFTYLGGKTDQIYLSGSFFNWQEKKLFKKNSLGIHYYFFDFPLAAGTHNYRFSINGFWINDPEQTQVRNDNQGELVSYFSLKKPLYNLKQNPKKLKNNHYRFYLKDQNFKKVFWASDENRWDETNDKLKKEGDFWLIEKTLFSQNSLYIFVADGKYLLDPLNPKTLINSHGLEVNYVHLFE